MTQPPREVERTPEALPFRTMTEGVLYLLVSHIADDEAIECRCGQPPYTDGDDCPRCSCIAIRDVAKKAIQSRSKNATAVNSRAPLVGALEAAKELPELIREIEVGKGGEDVAIAAQARVLTIGNQIDAALLAAKEG